MMNDVGRGQSFCDFTCCKVVTMVLFPYMDGALGAKSYSHVFLGILFQSFALEHSFPARALTEAPSLIGIHASM